MTLSLTFEPCLESAGHINSRSFIYLSFCVPFLNCKTINLLDLIGCCFEITDNPRVRGFILAANLLHRNMPACQAVNDRARFSRLLCEDFQLCRCFVSSLSCTSPLFSILSCILMYHILSLIYCKGKYMILIYFSCIIVV